jgi:hypothetical protein
MQVATNIVAYCRIAYSKFGFGILLAHDGLSSVWLRVIYNFWATLTAPQYGERDG